MAHWLTRLTQRQTMRRDTLRSHPLALERLEKRYALTGFCDSGACVAVELLAEFDTFGNQIETVQAYGDGDDAFVGFSIYDTGASVITWSAGDQALFQLTGIDETGIPIKVPGGAAADAIGGPLVGDVSQPATIRADGLHALDFTGGIDFAINFENPGRAEGVQSFVGTSPGSAQLPTITGVPIHYPTPSHTSGVAARIDMNAYEYDLGALFPEFGDLFEDLILYAPDIFFVDSGQTLETSPDGDTTTPFRIPLDLLGGDNHANPGDEITYVENPVQSNVFFADDGAEVTDQTLLFDTGAQLSVISTEIALSLGLNLDAPTMTIDVQGAAGSSSIPGYFIDELQLPIDNDGDGTFDGGLQFTNVPIFVLDLIPELDGIIGMNLFNTADVMLYDPFDPLGPSLQTRFFNDLARQELADEQTLDPDLNGDGEVDESEQSLVNSAALLAPTLAGSIPAGTRTLANLGLGNPVSEARVVGKHLFYNDSPLDGHDPAANAADDNALASSLTPLRPGQAATSQNVSGSVNGITGAMIDVAELADASTLSAADFEFRFGNTGDFSQWSTVQPESIDVRAGAGQSGSDRISLTFNGEQLRSGWLEVRIRASEATGLEYDDVFYFGNQPADTDGNGEVDAVDFSSIRQNPRNFLNPATNSNRLDVNHDSKVDAIDILMARENLTSLADRLPMITPPAADLGGGFTATLTLAGSTPARRASLAPAVPRGVVLPERESREVNTADRETQPQATGEPIGPVPADSIDQLMASYVQVDSTAESSRAIAAENDVSAEELDVCFAQE